MTVDQSQSFYVGGEFAQGVYPSHYASWAPLCLLLADKGMMHTPKTHRRDALLYYLHRCSGPPGELGSRPKEEGLLLQRSIGETSVSFSPATCLSPSSLSLSHRPLIITLIPTWYWLCAQETGSQLPIAAF